ncbi:uncharacterized protein [Panulirus ornatus]|uniref:uncharacterized protein n=1 Tax=Panulirus ornatus TaxID=150431 RepID=UPI003A87DE12
MHVKGAFSTWTEVTSGVPQDSLLGPTFFLIYVHDLQEASKEPGDLLKFAFLCIYDAECERKEKYIKLDEENATKELGALEQCLATAVLFPSCRGNAGGLSLHRGCSSFVKSNPCLNSLNTEGRGGVSTDTGGALAAEILLTPPGEGQTTWQKAQTDWLACGERRCRAQRVAEVVAAREDQYLADLHRRRCRLRVLLEEEEAVLEREMRQKVTQHYERELAARVEAAAAAANQLEEERLRQVHLADEQRRRHQCHQYREAYSREVQRYLNQTRPHEITLRNHMRRLYGVEVPPGKKH